jgi:hypothetical protein
LPLTRREAGFSAQTYPREQPLELRQKAYAQRRLLISLNLETLARNMTVCDPIPQGYKTTWQDWAALTLSRVLSIAAGIYSLLPEPKT